MQPPGKMKDMQKSEFDHLTKRQQSATYYIYKYKQTSVCPICACCLVNDRKLWRDRSSYVVCPSCRSVYVQDLQSQKNERRNFVIYLLLVILISQALLYISYHFELINALRFIDLRNYYAHPAMIILISWGIKDVLGQKCSIKMVFDPIMTRRLIESLCLSSATPSPSAMTPGPTPGRPGGSSSK